MYRDKKQDPQDSVFASTRDITPDIITFYKAFFDREETPLEDKGSILIHEVAHLVGLTSDRETKAINSAEALRNFLLLCTGKVTEDELFLTEEEAKALEKLGEAPEKIPTRTGEHLYDENQPRVEKGNPNGGQWTSDGTNGGSPTDDDGKDSGNTEDSDADEDEENSESNDTNETDDSVDKNKEEDNDDKAHEEKSEEVEESPSEEIKEGTKEVLEDMGKSDDEIAETLEDMTMDDIKEIILEAKEIISEKFNDITSKAKAALKETLDNFLSIFASKDDTQEESDSNNTNDTNSTESENTTNTATEESSASTGYKDDNFTLSSVGKNRTSDGNKIEAYDAVKFEDENGNSTGAWFGLGGEYKDENLIVGEKYPLLVEAEIQKSTLSYEGNPDVDTLDKLGEALKIASVFEEYADENNTLNYNRIPILNILDQYLNNPDEITEDLDFVDVKVKISLQDYKALENAIIENQTWSKSMSIASKNDTELTYEEQLDRLFALYFGCHDDKTDKTKKEGLLVNYKKILEYLQNGKVLYEMKFRINLINKTVELID